ncbi:uncharacterized protein AMSG_11662 [Thecamonas trahens ATCC 50062]|uniref:ATP-polyphosphate phosphotransferase n=1 Tax=Thecamonas trahens ATCC 50062 TaxID=461836 RepID=A0A0L0DTB4_THETB|nr:hypothetical protein AMSG_11662 [Thecamonas trahens ATCC 50062]KNC55462.1 hypothetical protein AMSG_11662 [Thecamonas trahens ATCC 50062]|eukprot:XP_013761468.1 hypothetical protein AMSG_11662 [Thecamonas trahens ATCC 50062]
MPHRKRKARPMLPTPQVGLNVNDIMPHGRTPPSPHITPVDRDDAGSAPVALASRMQAPPHAQPAASTNGTGDSGRPATVARPGSQQHPPLPASHPSAVPDTPPSTSSTPLGVDAKTGPSNGKQSHAFPTSLVSSTVHDKEDTPSAVAIASPMIAKPSTRFSISPSATLPTSVMPAVPSLPADKHQQNQKDTPPAKTARHPTDDPALVATPEPASAAAATTTAGPAATAAAPPTSTQAATPPSPSPGDDAEPDSAPASAMSTPPGSSAGTSRPSHAPGHSGLGASAAAATTAAAAAAASSKAVRFSVDDDSDDSDEEEADYYNPFNKEPIVLPRVGMGRMEQVLDMSIAELASSPLVFNRELSELDFFWRVLYEAMDEKAPLLERIKFLAITSGNIDGYVGKRVGNLTKVYSEELQMAADMGEGYRPQLVSVYETIHSMTDEMGEVFSSVTTQLTAHGVHVLRMAELTPEELEPLREVFVYDGKGSLRFVYLPVPLDLGRWIQISSPRGRFCYVRSEDLIRHFLPTMYPLHKIVAAHVFRDVLELMSSGIDMRRYAQVVRLEVTHDVHPDVIEMLSFHLNIERISIYSLKFEELIGLADMMFFVRLPLPALKYRPWRPIPHPSFRSLTQLTNGRPRPLTPDIAASVFDLVSEQDIYIQFPYVSFESTVQIFVQSAAIDPQVLSIKMTLYRLASQDAVVDALINAVANGKEVTVIVELKASYDEARNLAYATALEQAGATVCYGLQGMKTHGKIIRVVRSQPDGLRTYSLVATGNFNSTTAPLYIDMGLLTAHPEIGHELGQVFNYLTSYCGRGKFKKLLVSPFNTTATFVKLIKKETRNAEAGKKALIIARLNGLTDKTITAALYEAAAAGVKIELLVRGMARIRPGIPGKTENVRVMSYVGRFLEHSRIYYFYNDGKPRYYLGSADWMTRNLKFRIEVLTPVYDKNIQACIMSELQLYLSPERANVWDMQPDGRYQRRQPPRTTTNRMGVWGIMMDSVEVLDAGIQTSHLHKFRSQRKWDATPVAP